MRDHLLAIDNGTQSVRALVFDLRGNLIAKAQVPLEPYFTRRPGWAEQNAASCGTGSRRSRKRSPGWP
jgi:sugar (pentulose or hexulose) kinase